MARVDFYHLQKFRLEDALPRLLKRVLDAGRRAVVIAGSVDRVEDLNRRLWSDRDGWLPHGSASDGHAPHQPIWLTDDPQDNPNGADVLVLCDGMNSAQVDSCDRTLDLFDGRDPAATQGARERWSACKAAGHDLHYWRQSDTGGWVEDARSESSAAP